MMTPTEFSSRFRAMPRTPVRDELDHLAVHDAGEAVDARDAVADSRALGRYFLDGDLVS